VVESVVGVWLVSDLGVKTGSSLYSSFSGRTIDLNTHVLTGTSLLVDYNRAGSVRNYLSGTSAGVSRVDVSVDTQTEEGLVQSVQVTVEAAPVVVDYPVYPPPPPPPVFNPGVDLEDDPNPTVPELPDYSTYYTGGTTPGGTTPPETPQPPAEVTYYVIGPSLLHKTSIYDMTFGPWSIARSDGSGIQTTNISVQGSGYLVVVYTNKLKVGGSAVGQTITITTFGTVYGVGQVSASMQVTIQPM
jgi:hypothetical protein